VPPMMATGVTNWYGIPDVSYFSACSPGSVGLPYCAANPPAVAMGSRIRQRRGSAGLPIFLPCSCYVNRVFLIVADYIAVVLQIRQASLRLASTIPERKTTGREQVNLRGHPVTPKSRGHIDAAVAFLDVWVLNVRCAFIVTSRRSSSRRRQRQAAEGDHADGKK
jgi:hypothetical protein